MQITDYELSRPTDGDMRESFQFRSLICKVSKNPMIREHLERSVRSAVSPRI